MINVLRAEIRRLFARRLTMVALLGLLALIGLFQLQVNAMVQPPSAADVAMAQDSYDQYLKDWEANHEQWEAECQESGGTAQECAQPRPEPTDWGLAATPYDQAVTVAVTFGSYLSGLVVFIVTASFIGAEISTGSLANWLTFVPNRGRVFTSKLLVAAACSLLVGLVVGVLTVGISALLTLGHDQPLTGLDGIMAMAARGSLVTFAFGLLGYCFALLTGSTGASVGILLGAMVVLFVRSVLAFTTRWAQYLSPWSPDVNLRAVLDNGTTYLVNTGSGLSADAYATTTKSLSLTHGAVYWAVLLIALIVLTWLVFRRRDVT